MTASMREIQSLEPGAILDLFILYATSLGGSTYYFHAGTNDLGGSVVWQGNTYQPFPVMLSGFEHTSQGKLPRPTIIVANVDGTLGGLVRSYEDLVGAKVTYKRTLAKFLDVANFPGGVNPAADPTASPWADETFEVEQKTSETSEAISFQLVSSMDTQGLLLPARVIQATVCVWKNSQTDICPFVTTCPRTLVACKNHAATDGVGLPQFSGGLPFGGEPACNRVK